MSLLDKLGVRKEATDFWDAVQYAEGEIPPETKAKIVKAGESVMWAIAWRIALKLGIPLGALVTVLGTIAVSQITQTPPPGVAANTPVQVVAREVGTNYDVLAFCNDPATKVAKVVMTDAPNGGSRYIASRGQEQVNWADSPEGGVNDSAIHTFPNAAGVQQSEGATITKPAADCLKKKVGK